MLVHGIGASSRYFRPLIPALTDYGQVLAVELPGFGGAPKPNHALSIEEHAEVLAALLSQRGEQVVLIGHSIGAQIVVEVALQVPELIEQAVLIGPVTDPAAPRGYQQALRLGLDVFTEPFMANVTVFSDYLRSGVIWFLRTLPTMLRYPMVEKLKLVQAPTLMMRGERDPIAPRPWGRQVASLLPQGKLIEIAGAGHDAMFSHPDAVASEILASLQVSQAAL